MSNETIRLVQFFDSDGNRCVGVSSGGASQIPLVKGFQRVYDLAREAIRRGIGLGRLAQENLSSETVDLGEIIESRRILSPVDHPDPARCLVSLTGLTHMGSAQSRDQMHGGAAGPVTDTMRMFQIGMASGKPAPGETGAQPSGHIRGMADASCRRRARLFSLPLQRMEEKKRRSPVSTSSTAKAIRGALAIALAMSFPTMCWNERTTFIWPIPNCGPVQSAPSCS